MIYSRNIFNSLEQHLDKRQVTVITGIRRSGKTTIAEYLLNKIESDKKNFLDLENVENRILFKKTNYLDIAKLLEIEGINLTAKAYIVLDEIQLVPNITSVIKFLYDHYNIKFIVTGSSDFYLKDHFQESLSGRKRIFELNTLSFDEYIRFKDIRINFPKETYYPINIFLYNKLNSSYEDYLEFGGFPEVVPEKDKKNKIEILKDILNSYLQLDIKILSDFSKVDDIYKIIQMLTARIGSKIDYSKIASITGINRKLIKEYLLFFEQTYLIRQIPAFVKNRDREVVLQKKLYFTDNGVIRVLGNPGTGAVFENMIANQLASKGNLKYYAKYSCQEIDFILDDKIAFEVKVTPTAADLRTLASRANNIGIRE